MTSGEAVVVGAGIVGLASAYRLLTDGVVGRVTVVDKELEVGRHQSSHNSGVLHAGVYYGPGSLKARLCREGKAAAEQFCTEWGVPWRQTGKLIVATSEDELPKLAELERRATANGVPGLRAVSAAEIKGIEPHCVGLRALYSPTTGVVDFAAMCAALRDAVVDLGGEVRLGEQVVGLAEEAGRAWVQTTRDELTADVVLVCGGLQADRLAALTGTRPDARVVPFRGRWLQLRPEAEELCQGNIYPVPDPRFPFLGVHFTRRVDGTLWVGPNAVLSPGRERYAGGAVDRDDLADALSWPGLWRLVPKYGRMGAVEMYQDAVPKAYVAQARRYVPDLSEDHVVSRPAGVRAQLVLRDGTLVDDFLVEGTGRIVHVLNAPSPAATSSLAIGRMLAETVQEKLAVLA